MKTHLQNHVVVVTGAASGIGQQVAIQAAERGGYVIATDVNISGLAETQKAIPHNQIETHVLDVSKADEIIAFADKITPILNNRPLVLVNNAGVALDCGPFADTSLEDFEWLLSINLWGVIRMTKAFLPYLLEQNAGHIVNISSVFGLAGFAKQSAYCTAKFGVRGFTETLRMELFDTNIKTTCVHPGGINTNIARAARVGGQITAADHDKNSRIFNEKLTPTSPTEAARQILEAVRNQKAKLVIGNDGKLINLITRLFPVGYTKIFKKQIEKAEAM
jgi:NAD(P)-dependent dehydrogenase (short-subunit alcohol dehydrogenase family)